MPAARAAHALARRRVKLVLSRKGFDAGAGGGPSPIWPDGRYVSLPIPEPPALRTAPEAAVRYADLRHDGHLLGPVVEGLTRRAGRPRVRATDRAHLDPDLRRDARPRPDGWRAAFGQIGAAQRHLEGQGVGAGDLFLFFGWFRAAERAGDAYRYRPGAADRHVLFGWLQVDTVLDVAGGDPLPPWAQAHPHANARCAAPNVLYVARRWLDLPGLPAAMRDRVPGAGTFARLHDDLVLTAPTVPGGPPVGRSTWRLPRCFLPADGVPRLTYNTHVARWTAGEATGAGGGAHVGLRASARGQEFVIDDEECPGVLDWAAGLIERHGERAPG